MTIGEKIVALREEKKINQSDMAKLLKVNRSTLFRYERDERTPDMDFFVKLALQFNLSLDEFILDERRQVFNNCESSNLDIKENDKKDEQHNDTTLSDSSERELISTYGELNSDNQAYIRIRAKELLKEQKANTEFGEDIAVSKSVG